MNGDRSRCPLCYVALGAASRAPSPLRAAVSAVWTEGALARAATTAVMVEPPWPVGVQCPTCEATVTAATGSCSYCLERLPAQVGREEVRLAAVIEGPWLAHVPDDGHPGGKRRILPGRPADGHLFRNSRNFPL